MHPVDIIRSLEREVKEQLELLKPMLVDQSRSLDERWDMFSKVAHFMPVDSWYSSAHFELLGIDSPYDQGFERYQTSMFVNMYENFEDNLVWYENNPEESIEADGYPNMEQLDAWREAILASGYGGFVYDW